MAKRMEGRGRLAALGWWCLFSSSQEASLWTWILTVVNTPTAQHAVEIQSNSSYLGWGWCRLLLPLMTIAWRHLTTWKSHHSKPLLRVAASVKSTSFPDFRFSLSFLHSLWKYLLVTGLTLYIEDTAAKRPDKGVAPTWDSYLVVEIAINKGLKWDEYDGDQWGCFDNSLIQILCWYSNPTDSISTNPVPTFNRAKRNSFQSRGEWEEAGATEVGVWRKKAKKH